MPTLTNIVTLTFMHKHILTFRWATYEIQIPIHISIFINICLSVRFGVLFLFCSFIYNIVSCVYVYTVHAFVFIKETKRKIPNNFRDLVLIWNHFKFMEFCAQTFESNDSTQQIFFPPEIDRHIPFFFIMLFTINWTSLF